jgi:hypothetical protein
MPEQKANFETIYVRLLDEGTDVVRPVPARLFGEDVYELLPTPNYNPEDETWEFLPGSKVVVQQTTIGNQEIQLAIAQR